MMLTILHGADFHLDSSFSGLRPEQAAERREEQRQLLEEFAALARARNVDLVLLSGDLLDGERMYRETAQVLAKTLGSMPCPVFLAPGNHDYYRNGVGYATISWPSNVYLFTGALEKVTLSNLQCVVYGCGFTQPHQTESPLRDLRVEEDGGWLKLMCVHGDLAEHSSYGPITEAEIAASRLDYLALGHIHQYSGLNQTGRTWWAYPGCPAGRGFDETGEKGVLLLQAEPGKITGEFIPLGKRRYEQIEVDITRRNPVEAVLSACPKGSEQDIYRIVLVGTVPALDIVALEQALRPHFYGLTLLDHTRLPQDLWRRREEDSLAGLFLQAMWKKCQGEPNQECYQLAARFGLAALENGEDIAP